LFEDIGETIGRALVGPVATFDPEIIVIGSVLLDPAPLCDSAMRALVQRTQPFVSQRVRIVPGQLGTRAPLLGTLARAARMTRVVEAGM
jgi:predicted NBD/HSP70 family sugar kinase